ncbi:MAG: GCN5-related N-acetyltransferase [Anaerocolumna sp.]|jgi:GNAT superfamily N-acetyltransferase|nr:GCN5-related N-acetyltransferase [Anaerocolumna sp.]
MLFDVQDFFIDIINNNELDEVLNIYNSNQEFLKSHMDKDRVTKEWLQTELESMKKEGFYSCKIVETISKNIIGIMDFKIDEETYLSLMMLHKDFKRSGIGKRIYQTFEAFIKEKACKCIRIDVVTDYNPGVLNFWIQNGFSKTCEITLNWTGKNLSALTMKKILY